MGALLSRRSAVLGTVSMVSAVRAIRTPAEAQVAVLSANDRRLAVSAGALDTLQARADRHADGATSDPADPYTLAVAEIDLVAAGMAALPADTMTGMLLKVRAMTVPIVRDDDEAHGLALSVCRDLRRLQTMGALS